MKVFIFSTHQFKRFLFPIVSVLMVFLTFYAWQNPTVLAIKNLTDHQILYRGDLTDQSLALTFNVDKNSGSISSLLSLLKEQNIHQAAFFISTAYAKQSPKTVKKILDRGYEVGWLGSAQADYEKMTRLEIAADFQKGQSALQACGAEEVRWIRLPNEPYTEDVLDLAKQFHFILVHSSVYLDNFLTEKIPAAELHPEKLLHSGDIFSFDCTVPAVAFHTNLNTLLPLLKKQGYHFVSVTELAVRLGFQTKEIQ